MPIIVKGDGCYVWDNNGNRFLDGLSSLFCVNVGHGRVELGRVALEQAERLGFYAHWGHAHRGAIELAERLASLAPADLNRVFFTSGGSEAVESAWKLVRSYHRLCGEPARTKIIARDGAYHGTSLGALATTGISALRSDFEPLVPGACHVPNTKTCERPLAEGTSRAAEMIDARIQAEGPESVGAVLLEPVQSGGGCLTPPEGYFRRVRELCDHYGVLLISDEITCAWGRVGYPFGCHRYDFQPDIITTAKALTSGYAPLGAVIASDRIAERFLQVGARFAHGFTFGGHPISTAVAMVNLDILEREDLYGGVLVKESEFRNVLEGLRELPVVRDVRGAGYFQALELSAYARDLNGSSKFSPNGDLGASLALACRRRGLLCRAVGRDHPVIQLAPPLIAASEQFQEIGEVLHEVLSELEPCR